MSTSARGGAMPLVFGKRIPMCCDKEMYYWISSLRWKSGLFRRFRRRKLHWYLVAIIFWSQFSITFDFVLLNLVKCKPGQYQCGDGKCVDRDAICNGVYDCVDAADERDCSKLLSKLFSLKKFCFLSKFHHLRQKKMKIKLRMTWIHSGFFFQKIHCIMELSKMKIVCRCVPPRPRIPMWIRPMHCHISALWWPGSVSRWNWRTGLQGVDMRQKCRICLSLQRPVHCTESSMRLCQRLSRRLRWRKLQHCL